MAACPACGSTNLDTSVQEGQTYCGECGFVVENTHIVTDVTFVESGGGSNIVGQFVSAETGKNTSALPGYNRTSREQTIAQATRRIRQVAGAMKLKSHHVDAANRLYKLALSNGFTNGRKRDHVVAACLYIVIRRTQSPHMLFDFCAVLQDTPIRVICHTYLELCSKLKISPPIIDPSLYITRFASQLEFNEKTQQVSETALRFVRQMSRDWIQTGRRPSGICGAALLMASRIHGFNRTFEDVVRILRIGDSTLRRRIAEFQATPSSRLTPAQFETMTLHSETAPPKFNKHRKAEAASIERSLLHFQRPDLSIEEISQFVKDKMSTSSSKKKKQAAEEKKRKAADMGSDSEKEGTAAKRRRIADAASASAVDLDDLYQKYNDDGDESDSEVELPEDEVTQEIQEALKSMEDIPSDYFLHPSNMVAMQSKVYEAEAGTSGEVPVDQQTFLAQLHEVVSIAKGAPQKGANVIIDPNPRYGLVIDPPNLDEDGSEKFDDVNMDELDTYLYSDRDVRIKQALWHHINKDWVRKQIGRRDVKPVTRKGGRKKSGMEGEDDYIDQDLAPVKSSRINYNAIKEDPDEASQDDFDVPASSLTDMASYPSTKDSPSPSSNYPSSSLSSRSNWRSSRSQSPMGYRDTQTQTEGTYDDDFL